MVIIIKISAIIDITDKTIDKTAITVNEKERERERERENSCLGQFVSSSFFLSFSLKLISSGGGPFF